MTLNARRVVERRKQRSAEVFERNEKARREALRKEVVPQWYPLTKPREYERDDDLNSCSPGESQD